MASLTGMTTLGVVISDSFTKDAGLFTMALPTTDSKDQILLDLFGATLQVTIRGKFVSGTAGKTMTQFIAELYGLIKNGGQSQVTYVSDLYTDLAIPVFVAGVQTGTTANIQGLVSSVTIDPEAGNPNEIDYTIVLMQGSA